jgi:V-type H+-transporting ATPase subunit a
MGYYKLIIPRESAWNVMNELGELDCIHFVDYDPTLPMINRPFANYVKRCDDLLVKLGLIEHEMKKYHKKIVYCKNVHVLISNFKQLIKER